VSGPTQDGQTGIVFVCVGVVLAATGLVVAEGLPAVLIYACAAGVVFLGVRIVVRSRR